MSRALPGHGPNDPAPNALSEKRSRKNVLPIFHADGLSGNILFVLPFWSNQIIQNRHGLRIIFPGIQAGHFCP